MWSAVVQNRGHVWPFVKLSQAARAGREGSIAKVRPRVLICQPLLATMFCHSLSAWNTSSTKAWLSFKMSQGVQTGSYGMPSTASNGFK